MAWYFVGRKKPSVFGREKETISFSSLSCPRAATVPATETRMAAHTPKNSVRRLLKKKSRGVGYFCGDAKLRDRCV